VQRALQEAERLVRRGEVEPSSSAAAWESVQAHIRAEVDRQFDTVVQRMAQEQDAALQQVRELQERSVELEREVERCRVDASKPRRASAPALEYSTPRLQGEHAKIRSLIMTPRTPASPAPGEGASSSSSNPHAEGGMRQSVARKALRRHSTNCVAPGVGRSPEAPASARSSREVGRKSGSSSVSDLKLSRRWMMEQRANLIEELYPFGCPSQSRKAAAAGRQRRAAKRASAPAVAPWRPGSEPIPEH